MPRGLLRYTLAIIITAGFHGVAYFALRHYYATHLPHYDSVGSYMMAYRLLALFHHAGLASALHEALHFSLSQTQALFTVIFAPVLSPSPASLQLYNSLCIGVMALAMADLAGRFQLSLWKTAAFLLMIIVPDTFWWWQGGLLDWQRDPSFLCLLTAAVLLFCSHMLEPTPLRGIALGVTAGLTLLSRDSAPLYLLAIFSGPLVLRLALLFRRTFPADSWLALLPPALAAAPFLLHYAAFQLEGTLARLGNTYVAFAAGASFLESVRGTAMVPVYLLLGPPGNFGSTLSLNETAFGIAAGTLLLLMVIRRLSFRDVLSRQSALVLFAGLWTYLSVSLLLHLYVGIRPFSFNSVKHPFYPTLIAFFCIAFVAILTAEIRIRSWSLKAALSAAVLLGLLSVDVARVEIKTPPPEPALVDGAHQMITAMGKTEGKIVAALWHEGISYDVLRYYILQHGEQPPSKLHFNNEAGVQLDTEIGTPSSDRETAYLMDKLENRIYACADFALVGRNPSVYDNPKHPLMLYTHGRRMIARLLASPTFETIYETKVQGEPVALLRRRTETTDVPHAAASVTDGCRGPGQ